MAQVKRSPLWSDLTPELLGLVFLRLPTRTDRAFFFAVCRAWCLAARQCLLPLLSPVPWLILPNGSATSFPRGETFQLDDGVCYHNSCGEWLLLSRGAQNCFLMNPFTKATMPLPSLHSYSYYQERVDFALGYTARENFRPGTWRDRYKRYAKKLSVVSLVVCSARLIAAVIAVEGCGTVALCRPGDAAWSVSAHEQCRWFSNMIFFQGKLYALGINSGFADLISIAIVDEHNSGDLRVSRIESLIKGIFLPPKQAATVHRCYYLVESHGMLLMIHRKIPYKTQYSGRENGIFVAGSSKFEVFKVDFERYSWAEMKTLGNDQAIFLGQGCSRAVHVSPNDLSRDCIFFMDDYASRVWKKTTTSCELYDMKDQNIYPACLPMLSWMSAEFPATWIFSQHGLQTEGEDVIGVTNGPDADTEAVAHPTPETSHVPLPRRSSRVRRPNKRVIGPQWA